jgi:putative drug exporter of the RND superfamily
VKARRGGLLARWVRQLVRLSLRYPAAVAGAWLLLVLLAALALWRGGATAFTTEVQRQDHSDSVRAAALLRQHFPQHAELATRPNEVVVVHSSTLTVDDPAYAAQMQAVADRLQALGPDVVRGARSWFVDGDAALLSADRRATLVPLVVHDAPRHVAALRQAIAEATAGSALQATLVGNASVGLDYRDLAQRDLRAELTIGLPAAALVLLLVFGSPVAALLPLIVAGVAVVVAMGAVVLAAQAAPVYFLVTNMVVMMCMAVGIDVALFMLARWREERGAGRAVAAAALRSADSAGRAIIWSGATVALALLGLLLVPTNVFHGLALGAIIAVATAVLAALTLLPALLVGLGAHVNPGSTSAHRRNPSASSLAGVSRLSRWAARLTRPFRPTADALPLAVRRPWTCGLFAVAVLASLAAPAVDMKIGFAGIETLPPSVAARQAFERLQQSFRVGGLAEAQVVVHLADPLADNGQAQQASVVAIQALRGLLAQDAAFIVDRIEVQRNASGSLLLLALPMLGDAEDPAVHAGIQRLRRQWIPQAFADASAAGVEVRVGGLSAGYIDFFALIRSHAPWVMTAVLGSSFVLLAVAFRSLVVPLKAIVLNLLSVAAAYGALVLVFQHGIGAQWLGFQAGAVIEAWIPLFLFTVLYGLSMDYHVFLLSRMRECFDATGDNTAAVAMGLRSTARVIGGAALIMVAVFAGLAAGELVMFQQIGFGLAVALLLDATLVRLLLLPAMMTLLGARNWYAPRWLIKREPLRSGRLRA